MNRKIISLFTLVAFVIFSVSCYTTKTKKVKTAADWQGKKVKILAVDKTSGEHIEFSKDKPGRIYKDSVIGKAIILSKEVKIERSNIEDIKRDKKGKILEITNKEGKMYRVITGTAIEEEDKIIFLTTYESSEQISIFLSEIEKLFIKSFYLAGIFELVLLGAIVAYGFVVKGVDSD